MPRRVVQKKQRWTFMVKGRRVSCMFVEPVSKSEAIKQMRLNPKRVEAVE